MDILQQKICTPSCGGQCGVVFTWDNEPPTVVKKRSRYQNDAGWTNRHPLMVIFHYILFQLPPLDGTSRKILFRNLTSFASYPMYFDGDACQNLRGQMYDASSRKKKYFEIWQFLHRIRCISGRGPLWPRPRVVPLMRPRFFTIVATVFGCAKIVYVKL